MKSLYDMFMIPLEKRGIRNARKRLIPRAKGRVLEIGAGTGANLPFYQFDQIETLVLTDKSLSKHIHKHPINDKIPVVLF